MKKLRVVWYLLLNGCATCSVNGGLFCVLSFTTASARGDLYLFYFCFARVLMWDYTFHGPTLLYELNGPIGLASFHLGLSLSLSLSLYTEVHPSKHLVLVNGFTHQNPWYEGDTYVSYRYPKALAERWKNYFNNQIIDISQELWKDYHFIGSTDRIYVFGRRPYESAIRNIERLSPDCPKEFLTGKKPVLYCGLCNTYTRYHKHDCNNDSPWDPYDGYPSDAPDTD